MSSLSAAGQTHRGAKWPDLDIWSLAEKGPDLYISSLNRHVKHFEFGWLFLQSEECIGGWLSPARRAELSCVESSRKLPEGRDQLPARDRSFLTKMTETLFFEAPNNL